MTASNTHHSDTSNVMKIARYRGGIKLVRPDIPWSRAQYGIDTGYTINDVFNLPYNAGFINLDNRVENLNIHSANILGFSAVKEAIDISMGDVASRESEMTVTLCNDKTIQSAHTQIFEQHIIRKDELSINRLQILSPWYDERDNIIGVFGCNLVLGKCPLAEFLMQMSQLGLMDKSSSLLPGRTLHKVYLTKRESEILQLTARGKTAKRISRLLNISYRTVEHHQASIKNKFCVSSKSELIDKITDELDS
jgi:DNA-binding CsgD family transcriptional regulator